MPTIMIKLWDQESLCVRKASKEGDTVWHLPVCLHRSRQCSSTTHTLLLVTKAKCPTNNQYWMNQLTKEMETVVRRNLKFVVYPKKSQKELSLPSVKHLGEEEKLFKVNAGIRKKKL